MNTLDAIVSERRQLLNLAYRLLGSLAEAEDVVQETYTRWYAMSRERQDAIDNPAAWLTTVASRICLDVLGSARARRERYVGEWIPEPVPGGELWATGTVADPADRITLDESITMAFLVVLEAMTPAERVAMVLHDVFGYPFAEIGEIVGRSPAACRQLASSARRRLRDARPPAKTTSPARSAEIIRSFRAAWQAKDIEALIGLLDPDAVATGDGGGIVTAELRPVEGGERIARYYVGLAERLETEPVPGLATVERTVNGRPGLVVELDGVVAAVMAFEIADDRITNIWVVRNPDKLRSWTT